MATFTASHHKGQRLVSLMDAMGGSWRYMTTGRAGVHWRKLRDLLGIDGYVRALETTHGDANGWHTHYHLLLLFDGRISESSVANFTDLLYRLWEKALASQGLMASRRHGVDVRLSSGTAQSLEVLGEYLAKMTFEIAGGRFKKGRQSGRTPFEILADGLETGLADDVELWWEWEKASKGRRQLVWSRGLKARAGIEEQSDEEIAEAADEGETLVILSKRTWREVRPVAVELLEATEAGGVAAAMVWLEDRGLTYDVPDVGFLGEQIRERGRHGPKRTTTPGGKGRPPSKRTTRRRRA